MKIRHFVIASIAAMSLSTAFADQTSFNQQQTQDIQQIVHDYLVKNPQVLVEASQALQKQQMQQAEKAAVKAIGQNKQALFESPHTPTAGNPKGSVYLVEFFDYQCGHCRAMAPVIEQVAKNNPNVKIIFKELPIFGGASRYAAQAALAASKQGSAKYYAFHNALYTAQGPLTPKTVMSIAKKAGVNVAQLQKDMKSKWVDQELRNNFQLAQKLRLVGTPAFIISNGDETNYQFVPGATTEADLQSKIKAVQGNDASTGAATQQNS